MFWTGGEVRSTRAVASLKRQHWLTMEIHRSASACLHRYQKRKKYFHCLAGHMIRSTPRAKSEPNEPRPLTALTL